MLSVKEYAKSRSVSPEAVRRQLIRYENELEGHIIIENRKRLLDDEAVAFLDKHRMPRNLVVEQSDRARKEEIDRLYDEIDRLKDELLKEKERFLMAKDQIIELQKEAAALLEYKAENRILLEQKDKDREQLEETRQELTETIEELGATKENLAAAQLELNSFSKSWFGFYRKK